MEYVVQILTRIRMERMSLLPGFRFHPTDEELISFYLKGKIDGCDRAVRVIPEVDICRCEPWDLPAKSIIPTKDHEWFFFSPRGKKYPNGSRTNRATEAGYWKATGRDRKIKSGSNLIGMKRTLVFHRGRAPKGERTNWIMHEYRLSGEHLNGSQDAFVLCCLRKKQDLGATKAGPSHGLMSQSSLSSENMEASFEAVAQVDGTLQQLETEGETEIKEFYIQRPMVELLDAISHSSVAVKSSKQESELCNKMVGEKGEPSSHSGPVESSKNNQACATEALEYDDCYADILKGNIIELEDLTLPETDNETGIKLHQRWKEKLPALPSQGTANRRIKLQIQASGYPYAKVLEIAHGHGDAAIQHETRQSSKVLRSGRCSVRKVISWILIVVLVLMAMLLSFLLLLRGIWRFARFTSSVML